MKVTSLSAETSSLFVFFAFVFVALNAFFVMAEFALVKIRTTRLEILARKNPIAKLAQKMVDHLDAYLSATQLGITLTSLGLGWVGEPGFAHLLEATLSRFGFVWSASSIHHTALTMAFLIISALHIILGELVPKSIAIRTAEKALLFVAVPMTVFYYAVLPLLWILNGLSNAVLKMIRIPLAHGGGRAHSEEELKLIVEDSFEEGTIGPRKRFLLDKVFDFSHKTVADIMVPAKAMCSFYLSESVHSNLERAKEAGHSRFPLQNSPSGTVLGFVHMKDVIWQIENEDVINLFDLCRPVIFFNPDTRLDTALREFQRRAIHIGIIQGSAGTIMGMLTLEDVIEQLVGAIEDEFDKEG